MNDKECCCNCKHNKYDKERKCWYCNNNASYEYCEYTDYDYSCDDYEEKEQ